MTTKGRTLLNLSLILFITIASCAKQSAVFKVNFEPESIYSNRMEQVITTQISYNGSADFLNELRTQGITNPTISVDTLKIISEFVTGRLDTNGYFPVTTELKNIEGGLFNSLDFRFKAFGKSKKNEFPLFDSIQSNGIAKEQNQSILEMLKNSFSQINFPNNPLKVGETFEQETPLLIPFGDRPIELKIRTVYKLRQINGELAIFDIEQHIQLSEKYHNSPIIAMGEGKGFLYYDLEYFYVIELETETDMKMELNRGEFSVIVNQTTLAKQKTTMKRSE